MYPKAFGETSGVLTRVAWHSYNVHCTCIYIEPFVGFNLLNLESGLFKLAVYFPSDCGEIV